MRKSAKIITALSVAGLAVAAGSAFTAAGIKSNAAAIGFVGGSVSQTIDGATLNSTSYNYGADGKILSVDLTFLADADGRPVSVVLTDGTTPSASFTCEVPIATDRIVNCAVSPAYAGATSLVVTVGTLAGV